MPQKRTAFEDFPSEILSSIISLVVEVPLVYPSFPSDATAAARDLLNLSHVNTRLRDIVIHGPLLWTIIPPVNGLNPEYLQAMLERSHPHPFSLAILEGEDLPLGPSTWESIFCAKERIGFLYVEVDEEYGGTFSRGFLTTEKPLLKRCVVAFRGYRNVCLKFDHDGAPGRYGLPFGGYAPRLTALDFLNCYIPPQYFKFPNSIRSLSVRSCTPPSAENIGMPDGSRIWDSKLRSLQRLELVDCFSHTQFIGHVQVGTGKLELRLLKTLILSAPYHLCKLLAELLVYYKLGPPPPVSHLLYPKRDSFNAKPQWNLVSHQSS